jgi:hypothetical protein
MQTKTALVLTAFIVVVLAATMAIRVGSVYAATAIEFAPGQIAKNNGGEITAKLEAPGQQAAQTGLPASQYAPGQEAKRTPS